MMLGIEGLNQKISTKILRVQTCSLQIQLPHVGYLLSPLSEIRAKKFHTDDINMPRIQASLPNSSVHKIQLTVRPVTDNSWLALSAILTQTKLIMLITRGGVE